MTKYFIKYIDKNTVLPKSELISAVFLVALDGSKILAIKNDRGWEVPGGHVEVGEIPEGCLIREVKEEAGATFSDAKLLAIVESDDQEKYKDKVMLIYATNNFKLGEFTPSEDALKREVIEVREFLERHKDVIDFTEIIKKAQNLVSNQTKIYFITGVCGTGKTTALHLLKNILPKDLYDLHDIDERGVPKNGGRQWRFEETKYLVGIGKANTEKGITTVISGFSRPSETKELAPDEKNISFILLDADASTVEERILGRYPTEESKAKFTSKHNKTVEQFVQENVNFSETMRTEAKEYGSSIIDTNNKSPNLVVEEIINIVK